MPLDASAFGYDSWKVEVDGYVFQLASWDTCHGEEVYIEKVLSPGCPSAISARVKEALDLYNSLDGEYGGLTKHQFLAKCLGARATEAPTKSE